MGDVTQQGQSSTLYIYTKPAATAGNERLIHTYHPFVVLVKILLHNHYLRWKRSMGSLNVRFGGGNQSVPLGRPRNTLVNRLGNVASWYGFEDDSDSSQLLRLDRKIPGRGLGRTEHPLEYHTISAFLGFLANEYNQLLDREQSWKTPASIKLVYAAKELERKSGKKHLWIVLYILCSASSHRFQGCQSDDQLYRIYKLSYSVPWSKAFSFVSDESMWKKPVTNLFSSTSKVPSRIYPLKWPNRLLAMIKMAERRVPLPE